MKKIALLTSFVFLSFLASCGADKKPPPPTANTVTTSQSVLNQCGCTSEYKPVCGQTSSNKLQTFENECLMKCFNSTLNNYMRCYQDRKDDTQVCHNGMTVSETSVPVVSIYEWPTFSYGACGQKQM